jgi:hypothetical protein
MHTTTIKSFCKLTDKSSPTSKQMIYASHAEEMNKVCAKEEIKFIYFMEFMTHKSYGKWRAAQALHKVFKKSHVDIMGSEVNIANQN